MSVVKLIDLRRLSVASIRGELPATFIFSRCRPEGGTPFGILESLRRSNVDWLELKKQYEVTFERPVQALIAHMPLDTTTDRSPIIASIGDVIRRLGPHWTAAGNRRLVIFSDLLENTNEFSQYNAKGAAKTFAEARAIPYIRDARLDLANVGVTVFYLTGRPGSERLQTNTHERFWRDLIAWYGGRIVTWVPVPSEDQYANATGGKAHE
jgi:hypothetical protein